MQQEIRFAVVLYGGVSLAVYMNGVVQEFFHLVRATAADGPAAPVKGTEAVYRELGELSGSRFVVDILSGSSAGGINAIFLAKALANGQSLEGLSRLWLEEADLARLWNKSARPKSLLSGQTMFAMLRDALDGMESGGEGVPLQSEIDVFITSTDIQGLELPLPLAGGLVEKRHQNVFHLRYSHGRDSHFSRDLNPFLAFAARATSSFPLAFEPARFADYLPQRSIPHALAKTFFPDYVRAGADYTQRAFGDGGYLNNKPFNHAIGEIPRRSSDLPVRRMLVYVEPAPDGSNGNAPRRAPGPLRNSIEALITLHQYETIREDLRQVLDRNRLVERVREVTAQVDRDVDHWRARGIEATPRLAGDDYARRTLSDEIHSRGPGYAGYHRLKVRAVTEELARRTKLPQHVLEEWRAKNYREEDPASSESLFLLHFDLGYRQRRLRFLLAKVEEDAEGRALRQELNHVARSLEILNQCARGSGDIECITASIRNRFREVMIPAAEAVERCLAGHPLKRYFDHYEEYDQVTFPISYETQVGETEPVEVFRVSPLDAPSILDEGSPTERRRKLAGTAFFRFGAFLKQDWRVNDMLWGRLDGTERIITAVLAQGSPESLSEAPRLVRQAHLAILRETYGDRAEAMYQRLKSGYEVDRRVGLWRAARTLLRLLWVSLKMLASA